MDINFNWDDQDFCFVRNTRGSRAVIALDVLKLVWLMFQVRVGVFFAYHTAHFMLKDALLGRKVAGFILKFLHLFTQLILRLDQITSIKKLKRFCDDVALLDF